MSIDIDFNKYIYTQVKLWNFNSIIAIYEENLLNHESDYANYLIQIGEFERLYNFISNQKLIPEWWKSFLYKDIDFYNFKKELEYCLTSNCKNNIFNEKHFYCFILNKKISNRTLDYKTCFELFKNKIISLDNKTNKWDAYSNSSEFLSVAYYIQKSIDHFFYINIDNLDFFDYLQNYLFVLQNFIEKDYYGATIYYNKIFYLIQKQLKVRYNNCNIAVLVTGPIRGYKWYSSLLNLKNKIIDPLQADAFLFTWDKLVLWPGIKNRTNWILRRIPKFYNCAPNEIKEFDSFIKYFPNTYDKLYYDYSIKFSKDDVIKIDKYFKDKIMDNEYLFDVKYKNIGKLNNLHKMLYGRKKAFEMMEKYEKQNNKKYDFVLIVRPDLDYYPIEIEILKTINNNEVIGTHEIFPHQNEILDFFFAGHRDTICIICSLWDALFDKKYFFLENNRFIDGFHAQRALQQWFIYNNIKAIYPNSTRRINASASISSTSILFPDLKDALKQDTKNLYNSKYLNVSSIQNVYSFFMMLCEYYNTNNLHTRSQLPYKLGQVMVTNSKSLLGYIKMPFMLFFITYKHNKEEKIYQEKIKKDPSSKLQPLEFY
ncbi:capsular biosynthesis protein, partial [Campylobacter jejuni]|nr:capsular biosynthesis protein [Campylobacter jejuni]